MYTSTLASCESDSLGDGIRTPMAADARRLSRGQCGNCKLRAACAFEGLADESVATRLRAKRGESLFRAGDQFRFLFIVHSGFFKTSSLTEDGRDQVTGFHMGGEVVGMDGIDNDHHNLTAMALEDSNVCAIPFSVLEEVSARDPLLQHRLFRLMSKEIVRNQEVAVLLGSMRAEERVAAFLLNLSRRLAARGYSATEFHLRMTREEIGSFLGLKLETVSRTFSKFQDLGLFEVQNKHISGLNVAGLTGAIEESGACHDDLHPSRSTGAARRPAAKARVVKVDAGAATRLDLRTAVRIQ